jgi:hypothetical protein
VEVVHVRREAVGHGRSGARGRGKGGVVFVLVVGEMGAGREEAAPRRRGGLHL